MQAHLGPVMNLARIKLLALVLHALCIVQTVSLHKIASAMPTGVERDSNLRDIDRIARLAAMVCMALVWAYLVGEHKDMKKRERAFFEALSLLLRRQVPS